MLHAEETWRFTGSEGLRMHLRTYHEWASAFSGLNAEDAEAGMRRRRNRAGGSSHVTRRGLQLALKKDLLSLDAEVLATTNVVTSALAGPVRAA